MQKRLAFFVAGHVIETGNPWNAQGDTMRHARLACQPTKIVDYLLVVARSVLLVCVRVDVLDVDKPLRDEGCHLLQMRQGDIEARLDANPPIVGAQLAEAPDEGAVKQGLSTTKGYATTGGLKVQVVYANLLEEFLHRNLSALKLWVEALWIEAIAAS